MLTILQPASANVEATSAGSAGRLTAIGRAIAATVAYSDVFDFGPSAEEVWRYLHGLAATPDEVQTALRGGFAAEWVEQKGWFCHLRGRPEVVERRMQRAVAARLHWRFAGRYVAILARLPYVRMAAITGGLAVDNVRPMDDIDLLIVAAPDRLWLCRGFVVLLARLSGRLGPALCPNFLISARRLAIPDRSLFAARELFQMTPVIGYATYCEMIAQNLWAQDYLPNAGLKAPPPALASPLAGRWATRTVERALAGKLGRRLERWEMRRKVARLEARRQAQAAASAPAVEFGPDVCRGHFDRHEARILAAYSQRLASLGLAPA